jgi:hypothetical protein
MTTYDIQNLIQELLSEQEEIESISSFEEAGVLTYNKGVVVRTACGKEFQISIVRC